jgi:hypothetical protein
LSTAGSDLFDRYLARSRELLSDALAWAMSLIGRSQGMSWSEAYQFASDYLFLPLVVLIALVILVKQVLTD